MGSRTSKKRLKVAAILAGTALAATATITATQLARWEPPAVSEKVAAYAASTPTKEAEPEATIRALPANPTVLVMGDSFAQGFGADNERAQGYAYILSDMMGWKATVSGKGGTGFIHGNVGDNRPYVERIRLLAMDEPEFQPDLVILQGSINDFPYSTAEIVAATDSAIYAVRRNWENAQIVVTGPNTYRDGGMAAKGYFQSAQKNDVVFIPASGIDTWLPKDSGLYAEDGWHPNTLGHQKMAEGIAAVIRAKTAG